MDENIAIRKAEPGDSGHLRQILLRAFEEYDVDVPDNFSLSDIASIDGQVRSNRVFVLQKGNAVIGFTVLRPVDGECIELKRLYLTSAHRGRGHGAQLLTFALGFAKDNNFKKIRLETTSRFKDAVRLYKKFGFNELKNVDKAPGHDLVFELNLCP